MGLIEAVSPGLTSTEVGQFQSRALERVCLWEGLQTSGGWVSKHPFIAGESQRGGVRLLGYCLPLLCEAWREGKSRGKKGILGRVLLLPFSPSPC